MDLSPEVVSAAEEAAAAVEALMTPALPSTERQRIYQLCERLKESPLAIECGIYLSASSRPNVVRYFGLQLIEDTIKFHWNDLPVEKKVFLKDASLELMSTVEAAAPAHLRDALCRPLVEMVKREWPQQYAEFVPDMRRLAARGALHTELVLRLFLRLAEDVATFQTLEVAVRRRDVYRALVGCMDQVFALLTSTLNACAAAPDTDTGHHQLAETCLAALACYLEWAAVQHVTRDALLERLVRLLGRPPLQAPAAHCLAVLFGRHGKLADREPLLAVFQPGCVALLADQVARCCGQPPSDALLATLRYLSQALAGAVSQLACCWGRPELTVTEPQGWADFLRLLLTMTQHPARSVADPLLLAWVQILRHSLAARSAPVLAAAPALFACLQRRVRRPPDPAAHLWRPLELDDDEDAAAARHLPELTDAVRALSAAAPDQTFAGLAAAVSRLSDSAPLPDWETAVYLTSHVVPRAAERPELAEPGAALLESCLARRTAHPQLLSLLVSLASSLSAFLPRCPRLTAPLLERLFEAVTFAAAPADAEVRELRRHGCNALLALAVRQPAALADQWPALVSRVRALLSEPGRLSAQEGVTLSELLVLVHSGRGDYQQQADLVGSLVAAHLSAWSELSAVCRCPAALMAAVGLDAAPETETPAGRQRQAVRSQISLLVTLLAGVLLRCRPPDSQTRLRDAGYLDPVTGAARSPCAPHVLPHLPLLFQLLRSLAALDAPEQRARLHPAFASALDLSAGQKQALLSAALERPASEADSARSPLERMQGFLGFVYEAAHTVLVNASVTLGPQLFTMPRLGDYIAGSVLHGLEHLSDHRLRVQLRSVWRSLISRCPSEQQATLLFPLLIRLFSHLLDRLDARWTQLQQQQHTAEETEEEDIEAVVADQLVRQLSREVASLASAVLTAAPGSPGSEDAMEEDGPPPATARTVTAAGVAALRCPGLARPLLTLLFKCVGWGDSVAALKATDLSVLVVRALVDQDLVDDAAASQLLYWLLHGVEVHGHHQANLTSLLTAVTAAYVCLRPCHPHPVDTVISQIPDVSAEMVDQLREKVFTNQKIAMSEKLKKEEIKRLIKPLVSCSMSQLFQKKASIRNLLPMNKLKRLARDAPSDVISLADLFGDS